MKVTALEVRQQQFPLRLRGYDPTAARIRQILALLFPARRPRRIRYMADLRGAQRHETVAGASAIVGQPSPAIPYTSPAPGPVVRMMSGPVDSCSELPRWQFTRVMAAQERSSDEVCERVFILIDFSLDFPSGFPRWSCLVT
jgi:hypothetical protein